jgi:hypothetical protein
MQRLFLTALAVSIATACSPVKIEGELEGAEPKLVEAVFVETADQSDLGVTVFVTEFEDTCATMTTFYEDWIDAVNNLFGAETEADLMAAAEAMEAAESTLPSDHWSGLFSFAVEDIASLSGGSFDGTSAGSEEWNTGEFGAGIVHNTGYTDWPACVEASFEDCDFKSTTYVSDGGSATVTEFTTMDLLELEFSAEFMTLDNETGEVGSSAGTLEGAVSASWCESLENILAEEEGEEGEVDE